MSAVNSTPMRSCVIDDDFVHQFGMKRLMQRCQPAIGIIEFSNGIDALNYFKSPPPGDEIPCFIFLDINMPLMSGWEFISEFAKIKSTLQKKIDIYVLSSSTDLLDIRKAKANPEIKDYIVKPLSAEFLNNIFIQNKGAD